MLSPGTVEGLAVGGYIKSLCAVRSGSGDDSSLDRGF